MRKNSLKSNNVLLARTFIFAVVTYSSGLAIFFLINQRVERLLVKGCFIDKAFFYSVTAKNFLKTGSLTFDNIQSTNGFEPLWMFVQVVLQYFFKEVSPTTILAYSTYFMYMLFVVLAIYPLIKKDNYICLMLLSAVVILNPAFFYLAVRGVETPLMLVFIVLLVNTIPDNDGISAVRSSVLGVISGCLFLARTDMFWGAVVCLLVIWKSSIRNLSLYLFCCAVFVLPYLFFNIYKFDALIPISDRCRMFYVNLYYPNMLSYIRAGEWCGPSVLFIAVFLDRFLWRSFFRYKVYRAALAYIPYILVYGLFLKKIKKLDAKTKVFGLATGLHLLSMSFFYRELRWTNAYYFIPEILFIVYFVGNTINELDIVSKNKPLFTIITLLFCITFSCVKFSVDYRLWEISWWKSRLDMAYFLKDNLKKEKNIAAIWAGTLSEFSGKNIVQLDGVIGSSEYFENYLKNGKELDFLREHNIRYVVVGHRRQWKNEAKGRKLARSWATHAYLFLSRNRDKISLVHREGFWSLLKISY